MSASRRIEAAARAIGVWLDLTTDEPPVRRVPDRLCAPITVEGVWRGNIPKVAPGQFVVATCTRRHHEVIDAPTAALWLLGHARGLRVDLGECPACVARSGKRDGRRVLAKWEWREWVDEWNVSPVTAGEGDARRRLGGWPRRDWEQRAKPWSVVATARGGLPHDAVKPHDRYISTGARASRPCPACTVDGKPTGRHTIPWVQALLDAMPRDQSGLTPAVRATSSKRYLDSFTGDPSTRDVLAVLADKMQAAGDPLGVWLAAWLRPCRNCTGGDWRVPLRPEQCRACHGRGTLLGEHEHELLEALDHIAQEAAA